MSAADGWVIRASFPQVSFPEDAGPVWVQGELRGAGRGEPLPAALLDAVGELDAPLDVPPDEQEDGQEQDALLAGLPDGLPDGRARRAVRDVLRGEPAACCDFLLAHAAGPRGVPLDVLLVRGGLVRGHAWSRPVDWAQGGWQVRDGRFRHGSRG